MKQLLSAIGLTAIAVLFAYLAVIGFATGAIALRGVHLSTSEHPVLFWCSVAFYAFLSFASAGFAIETIRKR